MSVSNQFSNTGRPALPPLLSMRHKRPRSNYKGPRKNLCAESVDFVARQNFSYKELLEELCLDHRSRFYVVRSNFVRDIALNVLLPMLTPLAGPQSPGVIAKVSAQIKFESQPPMYPLICSSNTEDQADFNLSTSVVLRENGSCLINDTSRGRVLIYDDKNNPQTVIELPKSPKNEFSCPGAMALNSRGELLVVDIDGHRIAVFSYEGVFLKFIGKQGFRDAELYHPNGIAIAADNSVYIADRGNIQIKVFDAEGSFIRSFGSSGKNPGQFARPSYLAIDNQLKRIYVADLERIQVFSLKGDFLHVFKPPQNQTANKERLSDTDNLEHDFANTNGLIVDREGSLLVSRSFSNSLRVFDYCGKLIRVINLDATIIPTGLALNREGKILVLDQKSKSLLMVE